MKIGRIVSFILCITLCLTASLPLFSLRTEATGTHGFYMNCRANVTNYRSDGFMIDFYTDDEDALGTYWSNANWNMYTAPSAAKLGYTNIKGGGAYAGLQHNNATVSRAGIMSMWRWEYTNKDGGTEYLYADAMIGKSAHYDNEGSGTSCILPYEWKSGQWYRELLYSWTDEETGYTFIGTWYYDYEADKWSLLTYYNTHLVDSYINTDINQFLENYTDRFNDRLRSFRYKGVYFLQHDSDNWVSQPTVTVSTDYNMDAVGVCSMGIAEDNSYVWGAVDGRPPLNQASADYQRLEKTYTLDQPATPSVGELRVASLNASDPSEISWRLEENSTPQLSYHVILTDLSGNTIAEKSGTRPEVCSLDFSDVGTNVYLCTLTLRDVFGKETTVSSPTPAYKAANDGAYTGEEIIWEDVNRDGSVNISDVTAVLDCLSGQNTNYDADLDGNGVSNVSDVTYLLNLLSGSSVSRYSKGLIYEETEKGYIVADIGLCSDERINIPALYAGKPVTAIGSYAFAGSDKIKEAVLPQSIDAIGVYAFSGCTELTCVLLPDQLSVLKKGVFADCEKLESVVIPSGITAISEGSFARCSSLYEITVPSSVKRVEKGAFDDCALLGKITYTGTKWYIVRVCAENEDFLKASVIFTKEQGVKNGFVQEDGGIRYYIANKALTGFCTVSSKKLYFDPETALMVSTPIIVDGVRYTFTSYEYDDLILYKVDDSEPDKENDPQAWIKWLTESDAFVDEPKYKQLLTGETYTILHAEAKDPSGFELWSGHYQFDYCFNKAEIDLTEGIGTPDYPYTWEIFYRRAESEEAYRSITTAPWSVYDDDRCIYRIDTYDEGMNDLSTEEDGSPARYEFIFVISKYGKATGDIIAWAREIVCYTDSSEAYRLDAISAGVIHPEEGDEEVYYKNGYIRPLGASCAVIERFGDINKPENILDGNSDTVCGSGFNGAQSVTVSFKRAELLNEVFVQCKDEGITANADGTRGSYEIYAMRNDEEIYLATVPAVTAKNGGYTLTLDEPVAANGVRIKIVSWQGDLWACVADVKAKSAGVYEGFFGGEKTVTGITASRTGFADFGEVNAPSNILDNDQNTVCGSGYNAKVEQSVTLTFKKEEQVTKIYLCCKNEGTTTNADGSRGTYSVYLVKEGVQTLLEEKVPAFTGTDGGYTISLDEATAADGVKVVITSWQGDCWACVADVVVTAVA